MKNSSAMVRFLPSLSMMMNVINKPVELISFTTRYRKHPRIFQTSDSMRGSKRLYLTNGLTMVMACKLRLKLLKHQISHNNKMSKIDQIDILYSLSAFFFMFYLTTYS